VSVQDYTDWQRHYVRRNGIMNIVLRHVVRLLVIGALIVAIPQFASAAAGNGPTFSFAMGPMSAAQKNQGVSAQSDDAVMKPHYHVKHRHRHSRHAR
jgi:hypothetical protein